MFLKFLKNHYIYSKIFLTFFKNFKNFKMKIFKILRFLNIIKHFFVFFFNMKEKEKNRTFNANREICRKRKNKIQKTFQKEIKIRKYFVWEHDLRKD